MTAEGNPIIERAVGVLKDLSYDESKRMLYEAREKALRDERARIKTARSEGEEKGRMEGEALGIKKGRMEGRMEGREKAKKTMLFNMRKHGLTPEQMSAFAGISPDEVRRLLKELEQ